MTTVLLHAFPLDERMWQPQLASLGSDEINAPRLYGAGSSLDEWAGRIVDGLEEPVVLVGASLGGYAALAAARQTPERLAGLVLVGARAQADTPERRAARDDTIALIRAQGPEALWRELAPKLLSPDAGSDVVEFARGMALDQPADDLVRAVEAMRDRPDATAALAALDVPVLIAVGEADPFLPVADAEELAQAARAGRLVVFDGAGHLPNLERPERFNAELADFLAGIR